MVRLVNILTLSVILKFFSLGVEMRGQEVDRSTSPLTTDLEPSWLEATMHPQTGLLSRNVRSDEAAGYFAILNHARQLPLADLKSGANLFQQERLDKIRNDPNFRFYFQKRDAEFPTFADLFRHPEAYHGKLVTFHGHLRRLVSSPAGETPHDLQQLHEAWLYVEDAQQNPVVVVCTELPVNIPTGTDILVDFVSVTGYFFKKYGYEDRSGQLRFAPLILAQRLEWTPRSTRDESFSRRGLFALTLGIAAATAIGLWLANRSRRTIRRKTSISES